MKLQFLVNFMLMLLLVSYDVAKAILLLPSTKYVTWSVSLSDVVSDREVLVSARLECMFYSLLAILNLTQPNFTSVWYAGLYVTF